MFSIRGGKGPDISQGAEQSHHAFPDGESVERGIERQRARQDHGGIGRPTTLLASVVSAAQHDAEDAREQERLALEIILDLLSENQRLREAQHG